MRKQYIIIIALLLILSSATVSRASWWWFGEDKLPTYRQQKNLYDVANVHYRYSEISQTKSSIDQQFVICTNPDCQKTNLVRDFNPPKLAALFSADPDITITLNSSLTPSTPLSSIDKEPHAVTTALVVTEMTGTEPMQEKAPANGTSQIISQEEIMVNNSICSATIYFDFDVYVLSAESKNSIKVVSECFNASKQAASVKGYTCDIGTKQYNDFLALERARAVAAELVSHGVRVAIVEGEGKCCYVSDEKDKNRRVEITVSM